MVYTVNIEKYKRKANESGYFKIKRLRIYK